MKGWHHLGQLEGVVKLDDLGAQLLHERI